MAGYVGQPEVVTIVGKRPTTAAEQQIDDHPYADAANWGEAFPPDQKVALKNELIAIAKKMPENFIDGVSKENIRL